MVFYVKQPIGNTNRLPLCACTLTGFEFESIMQCGLPPPEHAFRRHRMKAMLSAAHDQMAGSLEANEGHE